MVDGKGDVAFFKHGTVEKAIKKGHYGNQTDYEYLCRDGSRKEIGEHATCYTGVNPAYAVVTRKGNTKIAAIITILTDMSEMYGVNQTNPSQFQLFNSTKYNGEDLLFKDSTTTLVAIATEKQTYQVYLGNDYVKDIEALTECDFLTTTQPPTTSISTQPPSTSISTNLVPYITLILLTALLAMGYGNAELNVSQ